MNKEKDQAAPSSEINLKVKDQVSPSSNLYRVAVSSASSSSEPPSSKS